MVVTNQRNGGIVVANTRKKIEEEQGGAPALGQGDGGGQVTGNLAVLGLDDVLDLLAKYIYYQILNY
jgi:hypothetical protein